MRDPTRRKAYDAVIARSLRDHLLCKANEQTAELMHAFKAARIADEYTYEVMLAAVGIMDLSDSNQPDFVAYIERTVLSKLSGLGLSEAALPELLGQVKRLALKQVIMAESLVLLERLHAGASRFPRLKSLLGHPDITGCDIIGLMTTALEHSLDARLTNVSVPLETILGSIQPAITGLMSLDPTAKLLEFYLLKVRAYVRKHRATEFGPAVVALLNEAAALNKSSKRIHFDTPEIDPRNFDSNVFGDIRASTKTADILAILANFFESSADLIRQFKGHLIATLTAAYCESVNFRAQLKEASHRLGWFRSKFDGEEWHECQVILLDFDKSASLNSSAHPFQMLRISSISWPEFEPASFYLPSAELMQCHREVEQRAMILDKDKLYTWTNSYGQVELEVQFDNGTVDFDCTPDEASVLVVAVEQASATFDSLQAQTGFSGLRLKAALFYWVRKKVLLWDGGDNFAIARHHVPGAEYVDCDPTSWTIEHSRCLEGSSVLHRVLPLIRGILSNLGAMPLGQIHANLQRIWGGYGSQESELHVFLEVQVSGGILCITDEGFYNVVSKH